jgi:hypothetical protein
VTRDRDRRSPCPRAFALLALAGLAGGCTAGDRAESAAAPEPPQGYLRYVEGTQARDDLPGMRPEERIRRMDDGRYEIGLVIVDARARRIELPCVVNQREGLVEVMLCTPWGKTHESLLVTPVRPENLHLALLLLGLKEGSNPGWQLSSEVEMRPPKWRMPPGDGVDASVVWTTDAGERTMRLERWLVDERADRATNGDLPSTPWVFTGSVLDENGRYMADFYGSIVTNYHDATAVLDFPLERGRDDDSIVAATERIPPIGTTVTLRLEPTPQ